MHNDLEDLSQEHNAYVTNAEHEFELMNQRIESLEKSLKESKTNFDNESNKNKLNIENMNDVFNNERKELQNKIDNISSELNNKEKALSLVFSKFFIIETSFNPSYFFLNSSYLVEDSSLSFILSSFI